MCNVARLAEEISVQRFVHISTTDVYGIYDFNGESEDQLPFDNNLSNPYPEFKIKAEQWLYANMPSERFTVLRPAAVWGPGDTTLTQRFADFLRWSPCIVHFGPWRGTNRWPLAHVRNVAMAALEACRQPEAAGQSVNILDNEHTTIEQFYQTVARIYHPDRRYRRVYLPLWFGGAIGTLSTTISNLLRRNHPLFDPSRYAVHSMSRNLDFSNRRFAKILQRSYRQAITRAEAEKELLKS